MDKERKKELLNNYKNRQVVGGIYCISCSGNNRRLISSTVDLDSIKNRYTFSININSCPEPSMREEWLKYGKQSF